MSGTDGLAEFLAARYDEAEAQVNDRLCIHCGIPTCELRHDLGVYDYTHGSSPDWDGWQGRRCPGKLTGAQPVQNPARVLREVAAGRVILTRWEFARNQVAVGAVNEGAGYGRADAGWALRADSHELDVRSLASIWSDHPDYKPKWAL